MTRLQRYILDETLKALLPAFAALMLIMVVGMCMQLLHEGLDVVRLRGLLLPMFAYCVPMVLPSAFLTAVIMNFGRLAADNEIVAVRAAGIHLLRVLHPVLGVALLLTALAVYFQFELNPRAHAAISLLKYDALKQVLLDKVALSAKRRLMFKGDTNIHIQYDDFVNGQMSRLLVIETEAWSRRPRSIITAASASVRPDPATEGSILFDMRDCVITLFGVRQYGEAETFVAEQVSLSQPLGRRKTDVLSADKYLPTLPLLGKLRELKQRVANQERFEDPDERQSREKKAIRAIDLEIDQLDQQLSPIEEDVRKYAEREPARLRQTIEQNRERLEQTQAKLKTLKDQQAAALQEIGRMRGDDGALVDYSRLVELQNLQKTLQSDIDALEAEIARLQQESAQAQESLGLSLQRAARLREQAQVLEERRRDLEARRAEHERLARWADDQDELNSLRIRIHKRLVQGASVFAFALIGIPLGILAGGRSVMTAFGLSFAIVLVVFYPFVIFGQVAAEAGALPIAPAMWAGNVFVFAIGAVLTAKVLRG